jgi:ABC-type glycerol-3-phosphate transport system permease component
MTGRRRGSARLKRAGEHLRLPRDRVHAGGERAGRVRAGQAALARPQRHVPDRDLHDAAAPQVVTVPLYLMWARNGLTGTLWPLIIPMARPGIAATALFQFFYAWNDYYGPLLYTSENESNWTLSLGLASFHSVRHVDWNLVTAATVLTMAPIIVIFFFAQRAFVQGVTLTGVKG